MSKKMKLNGDEEVIELFLDLIKLKDGYEPPRKSEIKITIPDHNAITLKAEKYNQDKYEVLSQIIYLNAKIQLRDNPDLLQLLSHIFFVVFTYKEESIRLLHDIAATLDICVLSEKNIITTETIIQQCESSIKKSDPFIDIHELITDITINLGSINFPTNVNFLGLDLPRYSTPIKTDVVRVSFQPIVGTFICEQITTGTGNNKKEYTTRKMRSPRFVEELAKFIQHGDNCIDQLVWSDVNIGFRMIGVDVVDTIIHTKHAGPITQTYNYAILNDVMIYNQSQNNKNTDPHVQGRLNLRSYTKKTVSFQYDAKLTEGFKRYQENAFTRGI